MQKEAEQHGNRRATCAAGCGTRFRGQVADEVASVAAAQVTTMLGAAECGAVADLQCYRLRDYMLSCHHYHVWNAARQHCTAAPLHCCDVDATCSTSTHSRILCLPTVAIAALDRRQGHRCCSGTLPAPVLRPRQWYRQVARVVRCRRQRLLQPWQRRRRRWRLYGPSGWCSFMV